MTKDRITGAIIAIIGMVVVVLTMQIPLPETGTDVGPRLFPYIGGYGMIICGIGIALQKSKKAQEPYLDKAGWTRVGQVALLLVLYTITMKSLGFIISTPIILFFMIKTLSVDEKISSFKCIIVSVLVTTSIYLLFEKLLFVMLPSGVFF